MGMNIFVLDLDVERCARYHVDKHVGKMVIESGQLLSAAHHILGSGTETMMKLTHRNHPCAIWARESKDNYEWLFGLYSELAKEFRYRRGKEHAAWTCRYEELSVVPSGIPSIGLTSFAQAMPEEMRGEDAVLSYRSYYNRDKRWLFSWTKQEVPYWVVPTML
jgi:hypothetical protein